MADSTKPTAPPDLTRDDPRSGPDVARRRLLRAGLGAAPVLMTLASRPALGWGGGSGGQCFSPSGFVSMPTSAHGTPTTCAGRTPGFWKQPQHYDYWRFYYPTTVWGPGGHEATLFKDWFSPLPSVPAPVGSSWSQCTFLDILSPEKYTCSSGPPFDVARYCVASLLNIAWDWVPVLTVTMVKDIWSEYITHGYYEPTAGVQWNHQQIDDYFSSTMI